MSAVNVFESRLDGLKVVTLEGEVWSARDLMPFAGYRAWQDWSRAISRAVESVNASGLDAPEHFRGAPKTSPMPNGGTKQVEDVEITRYGCYILFQNGDPRKPEIAAAQQYFAVQTRKAEVTLPAGLSEDEIIARALAITTGRVKALEAQVSDLSHSVAAWDDLASAEGDYEVADAAKILSRGGIMTGQKRLFTQLQELGWIFRRSGKWAAYQTAVDAGYLAEKPQSHYHPRTGEKVLDAPQVRVTVRGVERLHSRLSSSCVVEAVSA